MAIPELQLQSWANQGATNAAEATHHSLKRALDAYKRWPVGMTYDTYLQGSYLNATNIRGDSDVDLVAELTSVQYSNLSQAEKSQLGLVPGAYQWSDFRREVIAALTEYYGGAYIDTSGEKSVKVLANSGRLKGDVVVAVTYRYYENMRVRAEGITFWTVMGGQQVVNYPKLHFHQGAEKNSQQRTRSWYKQTIRTYKNARNQVVVKNPSFRGKFPSYFIECLLYNVRDGRFGGNYQANFLDTLNWLKGAIYTDQVNEFVCQNGMAYLFGNSSVQWNIADAREYIQQLLVLWNNE